MFSTGLEFVIGTRFPLKFGCHRYSTLSQLYGAVDDLAAAEVRYYYRRRMTRAWISGISRLLAWVSGTIGLLLPLLAATANPEFKDLAQYGYVFIAIAASCLTANSLFGGRPFLGNVSRRK
jgi:hypothetical protein